MAQQELESALRRDGESKAREIWQQVEAEAAQLRSETAAMFERQQQAAVVRRQMQSDTLLETARVAAEKQAQRKRLQAENLLAERLHHLAVQQLERLALRGGEKLFSALAAEIPAHDWETVLVHPRDQRQAQNCFPAAEIQTTVKICGGLKVTGHEGRIQIINTLEKRLEHLWPELLPELLEELRPMAGDHEAVA